MADKKTVVVGFGHRARQGKDTLVAHLCEVGRAQGLDVRRYAFADALKIEAYDFLHLYGFALPLLVEYDKIMYPIVYPRCLNPRKNAQKVCWVEENKARLRPFLQWLGTDYRRAQDESYWVRKVQAQIAADAPDYALISDIRFENEAAVCDVTVNVQRVGWAPEEKALLEHVSETGMDAYAYDYTVKASTVEELRLNGELVFHYITEGGYELSSAHVAHKLSGCVFEGAPDPHDISCI